MVPSSHKLARAHTWALKRTRTHLDGHPGAVESKRKENVVAEQAVEASRELRLGEAEGVAQVKTAVHVRVRKRGHELGFCWVFRGVDFVAAFSVTTTQEQEE